MDDEAPVPEVTDEMAGVGLAWRDRLARIRSRPVVKQVSAMVAGTAVAGVVGILVTPIISRLYTPVDVGAAGVAINFAYVSVMICALRYDMAVIDSKTDHDAERAFLLGTFFLVLLSGLSGLAMLVCIRRNLFGLGILPLWSLIPMILVGILGGFNMMLRAWNVRFQRFREIAKATVQQAFGRAVLPVLLAPLKIGWFGLFLGEAAGRVLGTGALLKSAGKARRLPTRWSGYGTPAEALRKTWRYPVILTPSGIVDSLASTMLIPLAAQAFGVAAAGQLFMAQRIAVLPALMLNSAVGEVFHAKASKVYRENPSALPALLKKAIFGLLAVGLATVAPIALVAPTIVPVILGKKWLVTGILVAILAPATVFYLMTATSRVISVVGQQQKKAFFDAVRFLSLVGGFIIAPKLGYDIISCVIIYAVFECFTRSVYIFITFRSVKAGVRA